MNILDFKKEKIAILGLSVQGISSAEFLFRHQIPFTILEKRSKDQFGSVSEKIKKWNCQSVFGEGHLKNLSNYTLIMRSTGIPLFLPEIVSAKKKGVKISSNVKLFMELCPAVTIGVTGTKGKGTTCKLIESILKKDGKDVFVGGNIGRSPLDFLEEIKSDSIVVLELSSFQLEDFEKSPHIAVILGLAPDHLAPESPNSPNYHKSFDEYVKAKKNLVRFQKKSDFIIVKKDDQNSYSFIKETKATPLFFSISGETDRGAYVEKEKLKVKPASPAGGSGKLVTVGDVKRIKLKGKHNLENICAALSVCSLLDCATLSMQKGVFKFAGYEHRLEFVTEVDGIAYYDDSAATNPEPAIAAINSFDNPIVIILGGSDKGQSYKELAENIMNSNVKVVYLIGDMAGKIEKEISNLQFRISKEKNNRDLQIIQVGYPSMEKIVSDCTNLAKKGDVILLSPACASFDMFKNYRDRGNQFKQEVRKIER